MALDPKMLESLPDTLVDLYGVVEIDILSDMARRISTYDYFIPAALHQNQKLQELGMVQEEIIKRLSALTGQTQQELIQLLSEASAEAVADDIDYYTRADVYEPNKVDTEALYAQLNSGLLQTEQAFFNITRTTANTATKQFERALDRVWLQINTGGFDYTTAIKNAVKDLAEAGIGTIEYKSGRIDNIEVAVRRAVVTGANQTALKTQETLANELEIDLVEVSAHGGARPEHAKWQGKVFSRNGRVTIDGVTYEDLRKATGYGTGAGLGGWNCRHTFFPYVPGASRSWTDKELKALEEKKITYNGEKYTEYEASQLQRGIERDIRKMKRTVEAIEAAGGDASEERAKLRKAQKSYTDFSEQTGMKKQSARTQIATKKAEREVKKANDAAGVSPSTVKNIEQQREQMPTTQKTLTNSGNGGIMSSGIEQTKAFTKVKVDEIPPMDNRQFSQMKKNLEKKGVVIIQDEDGDKFLKAMGAEAITLSDGSAVIFQSGRVPSASAMFEEVIHTTQIRKHGVIDSVGEHQSFIEYLNREIEANEKLLKNKTVYKLTEKDIESVQENLEYYYSKLKEVSGSV